MCMSVCMWSSFNTLTKPALQPLIAKYSNFIACSLYSCIYLITFWNLCTFGETKNNDIKWFGLIPFSESVVSHHLHRVNSTLTIRDRLFLQIEDRKQKDFTPYFLIQFRRGFVLLNVVDNEWIFLIWNVYVNEFNSSENDMWRYIIYE